MGGMQIAIPIYPAFTALDAVGPYEVLQRLPGAEVVFCSTERGVVRTEQGMLGLSADRTLEEVDRPDVILVPGGVGTRFLLEPAGPYASWIARVHETSTWTTSVCTGALLLAAAGVLGGLDATTHWGARGLLGDLGASPVAERVVERGKVITAAGVSSGIDMALRLAERIAGAEVAQAIQLGIEYDPDPPHDTGSLEKAPPEIVEMTGVALAAEDGRAVEVHSLDERAEG
jgi:putative intracellular protease/amidase